MKKVVCIDDKNLPQGAKVVEGQEYEVEREYVNGLDQRVYILKGAVNEGITKLGMHWIGYRSTRFAILDDVKTKVKEFNFAFN